MRHNRPYGSVDVIPKPILKTANSVYHLFLSGRVEESRNLRRNLIRYIIRELKTNSSNVRLWCMLSDLYTVRSKRIACLCEALRIDSRDTEANAEIARLYAFQGDHRFAHHFDIAIKMARNDEIEESILYTVLEAARMAGDKERVTMALSAGRNRFPKSTLFKEGVRSTRKEE